MIKSMLEELNAFVGGETAPYHKISLIVSLAVTIVFSIVFINPQIFEGRVAVIDLDNSITSTRLIEKIDSSTYIQVTTVTHSSVDPREYLTHDKNLGVLYIPKDYEKKLLKGDTSQNLGYFSDNTNFSQNSKILASLQEIVQATVVGQSIGTVSSIGMSSAEAQAIVSPVRVITRYLFNSTSSYTNSIFAGFIFFFPAIYLSIALLMLVGRLHVQNKWKATICDRSLVALYSRLIPYSLLFTATVIFSVGVLSTFNDLRFSGNIFLFSCIAFCTAMCVGLLSMILTWNLKNPSGGVIFMIFVVPPGFIFGGVTIATAILPHYVKTISYAFPLTWLFRFYRDIALRGETLIEILPSLGYFLIYIMSLASIVALRFYRERNKLTA